MFPPLRKARLSKIFCFVPNSTATRWTVHNFSSRLAVWPWPLSLGLCWTGRSFVPGCQEKSGFPGLASIKIKDRQAITEMANMLIYIVREKRICHKCSTLLIRLINGTALIKQMSSCVNPLNWWLLWVPVLILKVQHQGISQVGSY